MKEYKFAALVASAREPFTATPRCNSCAAILDISVLLDRSKIKEYYLLSFPLAAAYAAVYSGM